MTATPKRRWFQFSIRTLLVVVSLCGVAVFGYLLHQDISTARASWDAAANGYDADVVPIDGLHAASIKLRNAESRIPFYSHAAGTAHLARMQKNYIHCLIRWQMANVLSDGDLQQSKNFVWEAEEWLQAN